MAFRHIIVLVILVLSAVQARANEHDVFAAYYDLVYQIRVVAPQAGGKSAIGSGFQVSRDGLIVTNYHVISSYVQFPESHEIQYRSHSGELGRLELLDFDVINDLAVLRHPNPRAEYFELAPTPIKRGDNVYALGNPRDYGVTLVRGPNNGLVEHSYNEQILFSGSLNPGMSGGPALNENRQVVGVNVATAGSQLSFLVPVSKVTELVKQQRALSTQQYQSAIAEQIKRWQRPRINELITAQWPVEMFAGRAMFGEIRKDFQCWGNSNNDDPNRFIDKANKVCNAGNALYLDNELNTGQLSFSFSSAHSDQLNASQFSQTMVGGMSADNHSNHEQSTEYQCRVDFVDFDATTDTYQRITSCVRAYKKLPGLFDSLLLVESNGKLNTFSTHLSIAAAEQDQIIALNAKFIEKSL